MKSAKTQQYLNRGAYKKKVVLAFCIPLGLTWITGIIIYFSFQTLWKGKKRRRVFMGHQELQTMSKDYISLNISDSDATFSSVEQRFAKSKKRKNLSKSKCSQSIVPHSWSLKCEKHTTTFSLINENVDPQLIGVLIQI